MNSDAKHATRTPRPTSALELGHRLEAVLDLIETRRKAALIADRSTDQLAKYLKGSVEPPFLPIARLCVRTGVRMEWLATGQGPMMPSETAPLCDSQPARLDEEKLIEAHAIIDRALVLTRRKATPRNRARLVVMAYTVLVEEEQVSTALERIMQGVDAEFAGESNDAT